MIELEKDPIHVRRVVNQAEIGNQDCETFHCGSTAQITFMIFCTRTRYRVPYEQVPCNLWKRTKLLKLLKGNA